MPKLSEMTTLPVLENSSVYDSTIWEKWLEETLKPIFWKGLVELTSLHAREITLSSISRRLILMTHENSLTIPMTTT